MEGNGLYARPRPGEWIPAKQNGYLFECCHCALVHRFDFIVVSRFGLWLSALINLLGAKAMFRAYRDDPATDERRKVRDSACAMNEF
jgi:hypothetical protein